MEDELPADEAAAWAYQRRLALQQQVHNTSLIVALLGPGGEGLNERREIAQALERSEITPFIPEDHLPKEIGASVAEPALLEDSDVSLIFLDCRSIGSAAEFAQFRQNVKLAPKLRVLVPPSIIPFMVMGPAS